MPTTTITISKKAQRNAVLDETPVLFCFEPGVDVNTMTGKLVGVGDDVGIAVTSLETRSFIENKIFTIS